MNSRSRGRMSLIGFLAASGVVVTSLSASATSTATVHRIAGTDRYLTAVAASQEAWPVQQAQAVVLARGDAFPDALAGTPLAHSKSAPLLLTPPTSLNPYTAEEIKRALPKGKTVYFLGGTSAISAPVSQAVTNMGYQVVRLGGADRYATASLIDGQLGSPSAIFEATGQAFQYALVAGVAASKVGGVVVLTADGTMPAATRNYLSQHPGSARIAVGPEATQADPGATPVTGADVYDTSRMMAEKYFTSPSTVGVASGTVFADALSGGTHVSKAGGPLLLTNPGALPSAIHNYLLSNSGTIQTTNLYGGTVAISTYVEDSIANSARGATYFSDGTYRIGTDIPAGTYRTRRDAAGCYWERESGFSGSSSDIKANNFTNAHDVVTIDPSDAGFKTNGCGIWTSDLSALTQSPTAPFSDGTWIVGTDISSGTWSAPGGSGCYWARLSDFKGGLSSVIANDAGSTNPIVTINPSDVGFVGHDCGQWTKIS